MNREQREILRASNRANNRAYHEARRWRSIDSLSVTLAKLRRAMR